MDFKASHQHAPISSRKARAVVDMVRGLPVNDALEALATSPRRSAALLKKVIRSAVANAEQQKAISANELFVAACCANEGPLKQGRMRWRAGAMGRIKPFRRRTSHLEVTLGIMDDGRSNRRRAKATADKKD